MARRNGVNTIGVLKGITWIRNMLGAQKKIFSRLRSCLLIRPIYGEEEVCLVLIAVGLPKQCLSRLDCHYCAMRTSRQRKAKWLAFCRNQKQATWHFLTMMREE